MARPVAERRPPPHLIRRHALEGLIQSDGTIDWSPWYLTEEEDMGQSGEQGRIIEILGSSLQILAEERGWQSVLVATDNFFAWVEGEPFVQVSPDVYLLDCSLDDPPLADQPVPKRWEVWRRGHNPPRFAVEIVSSEWKKDYEINPTRYDHLGVSELVLADRDACVRELSKQARAPFVVYRRNGDDRLERVYRGPGPVYCVEIDAYLCFQDADSARPRVRVSRDPDGKDIVPTAMEKIAAAEEKIAAQQAEIEALRARLRDRDD